MSLSPTPAQIATARRALVRADPRLAQAAAQTPPLEWRTAPGGYAGLLRLIIGQQVSLASAAAIWQRTLDGLDGQVTAEAVLAQGQAGLRRFGLSGQKALYSQEIARAQIEGRIDFAGLGQLSDAEAIAALTAIKGVGRWTAETFLMFCEGRTDVFPAGDIALQEAIRWADQGHARPSEKATALRSEIWRPYRSVAAHLLWGWYGGVKRGEILLGAV